MNEIERFAQEVAANIKGLAEDRDVQALGRAKTMAQIAESKGLSLDQFRSWMVEAHKTTLAKRRCCGKRRRPLPPGVSR